MAPLCNKKKKRENIGGTNEALDYQMRNTNGKQTRLTSDLVSGAEVKARGSVSHSSHNFKVITQTFSSMFLKRLQDLITSRELGT